MIHSRFLLFILGSVVVPLVLAAPAFAGDGITELNQACAVHTGCAPGDAPGFPVTLDATSGTSFRLTSALVVPDENTDGIRVLVSNIQIDLNGFEIVRDGCQLALTDCRPTGGVGYGIAVADTGPRGTSVRNGSITGMGASGIYSPAASDVSVSEMTLRWNRFYGVQVGNGSRVSRTRATENTGGILVGNNSSVSNCIAISNSALAGGISLGSDSDVSDSIAVSNGVRGVTASTGSRVSGVIANSNGTPFSAAGIFVTSKGLVRRSTAHSNTGPGIFAPDDSLIAEVSAIDNGEDGFFVGAGSVVERSLAISNGASSIFDYGVESIFSANDVRVSEVVANGNVATGIKLGDGSIVEKVVANSNAVNGIETTARSRVSESIASGNGNHGVQIGNHSQATRNAVSNNTANGIRATGSGSMIEANTVRGHTDAVYPALLLGATTGYRYNVLTGNTASANVSGGFNLSSNLCDTNVTCP